MELEPPTPPIAHLAELTAGRKQGVYHFFFLTQSLEHGVFLNV